MTAPSAQKTALASISNSKGLKKDIQDAFRDIKDLKKQRGAINKKVQAKFAALEEKGIDKRAAQHIFALFEQNLAGQEGYLASRPIITEAIEEIQEELFPQPEQKKPAVSGKDKAAGE